jgi:isoquinoline 1-oxidoreductase beta subunit
MRDVIELAAAKGARWGRKLPKGHGLGLAVAYSFMSYTATVIEVAVDAKGELKVVAVDMAIDCGPQINPERIRAQMEGGAVMGLSLALSGEISFDQGRVVQSNFFDFTCCATPRAHAPSALHLVNNNHEVPPGGVGEPPVPPWRPRCSTPSSRPPASASGNCRCATSSRQRSAARCIASPGERNHRPDPTHRRPEHGSQLATW